MFHLCVAAFLISMMGDVLADEMMTLPIGMLIEGVEPFVQDCDPKPELEHMEELFLNKEDAQQTTKCLRHCLMAQFELFKEGDTAVESEKLVGFMALLYPEKADELNEIVDGCNQRNKDMGLNEMCEVAHSFGMCMLKEMQSREYEIPIVEQ
ncbi:uncharacterized protein LOC101459897 [Ceratitis capitata]|uniref:uncharacterized protein LOC101459897 n=1 Tax=Ceratitis capitata TaxID=7213 RepID=UPI000329E0E2|nr:uncharacterized protein LOC101459897 [Ceratitis capitata]